MTEEDLIQAPGMGAKVALEVSGRTLVQTEYYGRSSHWPGWGIRHENDHNYALCRDPQTLLTAIIEKDLDTGDVTYCHTRLDGTLFTHEFQDKWFDNFDHYEDHIYTKITLEVISAFALHEVPCLKEHVWTSMPVYVQDDFVFYGVNKKAEVVTDTGYYFNRTDQKYHYACAAYCPESGVMRRRGDVVVLEGKHHQAPRKVVKVQTEPHGDFFESVVPDYDIEKRIQVLTHILVACKSPVGPQHTPTLTLLDKAPPHPNPEPNSALVQWTILGHIFPHENGKGTPKRTKQIPWVVVYATEQRYHRRWTEDEAVADYPKKPDTKEHFGPYVKLVTWDSVGMCVRDGLSIEETTDPVRMSTETKEALKYMLRGVEDPAWTDAHKKIVAADDDYKKRLEKAQKRDQKRADKKFKRQQKKHDAKVQELLPDLKDMVEVAEYDKAMERQMELEAELDELKKRKCDTASDDEIAERKKRKTFWDDMRGHYLQVQADKNGELKDKGQAAKKLRDLIPVAARQIFTTEELNNFD